MAGSQGGCAEPRILFLDDLFLKDRPNRNPFEERIETERHDFTQSATTVGRYVVQLETGYTYFYRKEHGDVEQSHALPELLMRVGLSDDIEFRLRFNYATRLEDGAESVQGTQDLISSLKLQVTEQDCFVPTSAMELRLSAPTGSNDWTLGRVAFGIDYIYQWKLDELWTLNASTGFGQDGLGDFSLLPKESRSDRFVVGSQSIALGVELTDRSTMYNEFFALASDGLEDNYTIVVYNIGVDYYFTDNFVGDVRIGKGLTDDTDDLFCGVGGGFRF